MESGRTHIINKVDMTKLAATPRDATINKVINNQFGKNLGRGFLVTVLTRFSEKSTDCLSFIIGPRRGHAWYQGDM